MVNAVKIYYEDIMNVIKNENDLRNMIENLVNKHKIIEIYNLSSKNRYLIYKQVYYPFKFEKELTSEINIDIGEENFQSIMIRIFNSRIKEKEEIVQNDDEYEKIKLENEENEENFSESSGISSDESYYTDLDKFEDKMENMIGGILNKINKIEAVNCALSIKLNIMLYLNFILCLFLFTQDSLKLVFNSKEESGVICEV